jgi:hypothetical protein
VGRNQRIELKEQLDKGIRLLQAQAHMSVLFIWGTMNETESVCRKNEELHFCHTTCTIFNGGTVKNYLTKVKEWLDENKNEGWSESVSNYHAD